LFVSSVDVAQANVNAAMSIKIKTLRTEFKTASCCHSETKTTLVSERRSIHDRYRIAIRL
jgi:hypothetical protein